MIAIGAVTAPAEGEFDYVMIRVKLPNSSDDVKFFGINASGQAVGEATISGVTKAILWLPEDAYGLDSGLNILDDNFQDFEESVAYDISDIGVIVGQLTTDGDSYPYVWDLSGEFSSGPIYDNQEPTPQLLLNRAAFDINNDDEPLIVGGPVPTQDDPTQLAINDAFVHNLYMVQTTEYGTFDGSTALGISGSDPIDGWRLTGFGYCSGITCNSGPPCHTVVIGFYDPSIPMGSGRLAPIGQCNNFDARRVGYAVNADLQVVGFGSDPNEIVQNNARRRGVIWSASYPETTLALLPRLDEAEQEPQDENVAFDVRGTSSSTPFEIIGRSFWANHGVIWIWNGSAWEIIDLHVNTCTTGLANVPTTTGINPDGWISGWGTFDNQDRGWVLIPKDDYRANVCAGDISHVGGECPDGVVDVYDLMTLCNNWNTDGAGADLAEPYDVVDVFDLFMVIGENWACHIGADPGTESHQDIVENAGLTMNDWNEYMDVLQYSEDEDEKENYNCWMLQYLSECVFCPPCPDEDPYK